MNLPYEPTKVGNMIIATVILHNMAIEHGEDLDYDEDPIQMDLFQAAENNATVNNARTAFINTYF